MDNFEGFEDLDDADDTIILVDEFGEEREFFLMDTTNHKGVNYLLVVPADSEDDECFASIMKETLDEGDNVVYELVDDDDEFNEVAALFSSSDGDYEIEI